jgi:site-specific recombinase XerD
MGVSLTVVDLRLLAASWALSLRADRKSPQTLKAYADGVRFYLDWCEREGVDPLARTSLRSWVAALLDRGAAAATAVSRQLAVRRFTAWLTAEGELAADPFLGFKAPKIDQRVIEPLTDDQLRALLKACQPPKGATPLEALRHRRDEAILRLMLETGARAGEVVAMTLDDLDLSAGTAIIRRGKGGKGRVVPVGPQAAQAIDRYLRLRRHHRLGTATRDLWLGDRGKEYSYDGLHKSLRLRAEAAGITGFHPHRMRHTAAHRWLAAGGSESGLMAVAGWTRPDMLMRYTKAQASSRAAEEAARLNLGDL